MVINLPKESCVRTKMRIKKDLKEFDKNDRNYLRDRSSLGLCNVMASLLWVGDG